MPWKLGSPDEPTVRIYIRVPESMKFWLQARQGGASAYIRKLVSERMQRKERKKLTPAQMTAYIRSRHPVDE